MKAVVTGMIATYPVGGVVWDYGQYVLGLERLGFEVYYLEDTGADTYDPRTRTYGEDCSYGTDFLARSLEALSPGAGERWHFRSARGECFGISSEHLRDVIADAAVFINVSGGTVLRDAYLPCRRKCLIDTDPGFNQFRNYPRADALPPAPGTHSFRAHDVFFTYAERIGQHDCIVPALGIDWQPTRPPVVLECWSPEPPAAVWTTVMTWANYPEPVLYEGRRYLAKEPEFARIEMLPQRTGARLEIAVGGSGAPRERWRALGWQVVEAEEVSRTPEAYRSYVQRSRGEFSVAKNVYAATRSGWFSCRTVCYLAAGRPAVVQDTGFGAIIAPAAGLLPFTNLAEAVQSIESVERDYTRHSRAAVEVARTYFEATQVLGAMLERAGI